MAIKSFPGKDAIAVKGWLGAHKWLFARRISQLGILALFLVGPLAGIWIVQGNLSASMTLDLLPLTDPFLLLQAMLSGNWPVLSGAVGALIVILHVIGLGIAAAWLTVRPPGL